MSDELTCKCGYKAHCPDDLAHHKCAVDPLEPFRRAGELGCKRFQAGAKVFFNLPLLFNTQKPRWGFQMIKLPSESVEVNEDAAAVCAEWWATQTVPVVHDPRFQQKHLMEKQEMIDLCRAFGRKHGGQ
jgi:hypothetical protein